MSEGEIRIAAVGDICLGDHYFSMGHGTASKLKNDEKRKIFGVTSSLVQDCHIVFGNLECPLSNSSNASTEVERSVFRGDPSFAVTLKAAGLNIVNIANNHILQHGREAFFETIKCLQENEISPLGLRGKNKYSSEPVICDLRNNRIGFLGYSLVPEKYCPEQLLYASSSENEICQDVRLLSKEVDTVILSLHYGSEGQELPAPSDLLMVRRLVESGVSVFLGHHSHVFHPVEFHNNGLIVYSLGDYVFDLFWGKNLIETAVCLINIDAEYSKKFQLKPVRLTRNYEIEELCSNCAVAFLERLNSNATKIEKLSQNNKNGQLFEVVKKTDIFLKINKLIYFFLNLYKGCSRLKINFLFKKIKSKFRRVLFFSGDA